MTALFLLALILAITLTPLAPTTAYPVTSAEKQAEADELMRQIDALQTEINDVTKRLEDATAAQNNALALMEDAKQREEAAAERTSELQRQLGDRVVEAYRNGSVSYLEVIFGAKSFTDFLISWDMINRLNAYDAQLTSESKEMRLEAEAAHQLYAEQERIAAEKRSEIEELKAELEQKSASMAAELERMNEEIAELIAKEEAEAEAARLAAAAAAAAESNGWLEPEVIVGMGGFVHPCPGAMISSSFGWRSFDNAFHKGIDLAAPTGTPILATQGGTVIISGYGGGAGNWVVIAHGNGIVTMYMHASAIYVSVGESVYAGEVIAAVGSTGNSTGPHLHFQIEINGSAVDPYPFIY
ncbi:MAG: peptidoglycan DD-metalloendopeptidase family protein [Coriobacteriia bacterium]|nr:peptidoglycan DD-metalloendopeptidase family protein [Coriobacteriia bacterium]